MPDIPTAYQTLTGMLAPALFMTATGSLLITANNRLTRVVDRLRSIVAQLDQLDQGRSTSDYPEERQQKLLADIGRMQIRSVRLLRAIALLHLAFASFVGTSLMLAVDAWTAYALSVVPTSLAVLGVSLLLAACLNLFLEAMGGVAVLDTDIIFLEKLRHKRRAERSSTSPASSQEPT